MLISSVWFIPFFHFGPIFWLVSLFLYFLPAFLARNKPNFTSILILNILAGWTFIGWIIALVWAIALGAYVYFGLIAIGTSGAFSILYSVPSKLKEPSDDQIPVITASCSSSLPIRSSACS